MANTATLAVKIVSDSSAARADIGKSSDAVGKWGARASKVGNIAGKALAGGILAAGAAAVKFTQAAAEDAASAQKLADSLRQAAGATDEQVASVERWIEAQGKALGVADDELRPAMQRLATVTGDVGKAQRLAALAMDISASSGKPLKTVVEGLAKAQTGSITGLAKFGVQVKDASGETRSLTAITKDLSKTYAGSAAKAADTAAGRQKRLSVAMGELQEKIGAKLLPVMEKLIDVGFKVIDWIDKNQRLVGTLAASIGGLLAVTYTITKVMAAWNAIMAAGRVLRALFIVQTAAGTAATTAQAGATAAAATAQTGLNTAMRLNPIGLIITAVAVLVAGFVVLYKKSETFRDLVQKVGEIGKAAFEKIKTAVGPVIDFVVDLIKWVGDKLPAAWQVAKTLIVGYIKLITAPWRILFELIKVVWGWVKDKVPAAFSTMRDVVKRVMDVVLAPWRALFGLIRDVWTWAKEKVPAAFETLKNKAKSIGAALIAPFKRLYDLLVAAIAKAKELAGLTEKKTYGFSTQNPFEPPAPTVPPGTGRDPVERRVVETVNVRVDGSIIGMTEPTVGRSLLDAINRARRDAGLAPIG